MIETRSKLRALVLTLTVLAGCGDDDETMSLARGGAMAGSKAPATGDAATDRSDFDPQLPPTETKQVEAWLARGFYKDWSCEDEPSAKTFGAPAIHAHGGKSFVCNNQLLAESEISGVEQFPKGVASVKEILDASGKLTLTAVAVKIDDDSDGGEGWYWYEGARFSGVGIGTCTGCHAAAGSDDDHPGAGDFVYFKN